MSAWCIITWSRIYWGCADINAHFPHLYIIPMCSVSLCFFNLDSSVVVFSQTSHCLYECWIFMWCFRSSECSQEYTHRAHVVESFPVAWFSKCPPKINIFKFLKHKVWFSQRGFLIVKLLLPKIVKYGLKWEK